MRIGLLGGLRVEHEGRPVVVSGSMQLAVLFRLAVDAGTAVSYRALAEDVWTADAPENARAALQSIVSRLRSQLPPATIESTVGGYRLAVARSDVDALVFGDLVEAARAAKPADRPRLASEALALWTGEPWVPSDGFDWFERDLRRDRAAALELGGSTPAAAATAALAPAPAAPVPLTALVGREHELAQIAAQLAGNRLVTIIGPGGAGKTRLAIAAASASSAPSASASSAPSASASSAPSASASAAPSPSAARPPAPSTTLFVELAPVGPEELFAAILAATGRELRSTDAPTELIGWRERVLEALAGRPVLLVLDNCEHVIDAAARLAEDLLSLLPGLRILATSREPLGIPGEAFVSVGSLAHPALAEIASTAPDELGRYAAIELFRQRAAAANGRPLDGPDLVTCAELCARLDGLPLALELAAAKLRTMTIDEILAGLEDRFTLLTGGYRTVLPRHQTLRALIDWSWSLSSDDERRALARVSVFPGGIGAAEAGRVAGFLGLPSAAVFDALVDKSLLQRANGRYRALETIREYGIGRLAEQNELADARATQAKYVAERATQVDKLLRGPGISDALAWFDSEDDNIVAALRYTTSTSTGMAAEAVQLGVSCGWYWTTRDRQQESFTWLATIIPFADGLDSDEASIVRVLAPIFGAIGQSVDPALQEFDEERLSSAISLASAVPTAPFRSGSHDLIQVLPPLLAAFGAAGTHPARMLDVVLPDGEALGLDPWPCAILHVLAGAAAENRGDIDVLGIESERAVRLFTDVGDLWGLALAQQMSATWLTLAGRLDEALELVDASSLNKGSISTTWDLAQQETLAVSILMRLGRHAEAAARVDEMTAGAASLGNVMTILQVGLSAFGVDFELGDVDRATARIAGFEALSADWPRLPGQIEAWIEVCRAQLATMTGDLDAAGLAIHRAIATALATNDHPVIGAAALGLGTVELARGDVRAAVRALDLATAVVGAHDPTALAVRSIEAAASEAGMDRAGLLDGAAIDGAAMHRPGLDGARTGDARQERDGAPAPSRSAAIEALTLLVAER